MKRIEDVCRKIFDQSIMKIIRPDYGHDNIVHSSWTAEN